MHSFLERAYRFLDLSQEEIGDICDEHKTQIGRWINIAKENKPNSSRKLLDALRKLAVSDPHKWVRFLQSEYGEEARQELLNIIYFDFTFPGQDGDIWSVNKSPAELDNIDAENYVIENYLSGKKNQRITYWIPRSIESRVISFIGDCLLKIEGANALHEIQDRLNIYVCPEGVCMSNIIIFIDKKADGKDIPRFALRNARNRLLISGDDRSAITSLMPKHESDGIFRYLSRAKYSLDLNGEFVDGDGGYWKKIERI